MCMPIATQDLVNDVLFDAIIHACTCDFFLFSRREKRNHQISVTNLQLTCSTWSGVQSCLGKSMFPENTCFRENTLLLILSSVNRAAALRSLCSSPVSWGHWLNATPNAHPTLRKHNPVQDKSWAAFEAKATPASDHNKDNLDYH